MVCSIVVCSILLHATFNKPDNNNRFNEKNINMKRLNYSLPILVALLFVVVACEDPVEDEPFGEEKIYMPQAAINQGANNNYFNEINQGGAADTSIAVGIYRSGLASMEEVTVDLNVDTDTLETAMEYAKNNGGEEYSYYRNGHILDEAYYELPDQITIPDGEREAIVSLKLDKEALYNDPAWLDDYFILPLRISNPTKYELNEDLAMTMVIIQRNFAGTDVTDSYLANYEEPFEYAEWDGSRWGTLADWTSNDDIRNGNGYGGYELRNGSIGVLSMEAGWGLPPVPNGKIYQTFTLPAGFYTFEIELDANGDAGTKYMAVGEGKSLPDFEDVEDSAIAYAEVSNESLTFHLSEEMEVSLGFVCNLPGDGEYTKILKVTLIEHS